MSIGVAVHVSEGLSVRVYDLEARRLVIATLTSRKLMLLIASGQARALRSRIQLESA
jgi:hypothetical protein